MRWRVWQALSETPHIMPASANTCFGVHVADRVSVRGPRACRRAGVDTRRGLDRRRNGFDNPACAQTARATEPGLGTGPVPNAPMQPATRALLRAWRGNQFEAV